MKKLESDLILAYASLFTNKISVSFPAKWFEIIDDACQQLQELKDTVLAHLEIEQIKEKFGGLRIYTNHDADPRVRKVISVAEEKCATTCQKCGRIGKKRTINYLIITLCDDDYVYELQQRREH